MFISGILPETLLQVPNARQLELPSPFIFCNFLDVADQECGVVRAFDRGRSGVLTPDLWFWWLGLCVCLSVLLIRAPHIYWGLLLFSLSQNGAMPTVSADDQYNASLVPEVAATLLGTPDFLAFIGCYSQTSIPDGEEKTNPKNPLKFEILEFRQTLEWGCDPNLMALVVLSQLCFSLRRERRSFGAVSLFFL